MQELEKQLHDLKSQIVDLKLKIKIETFLKLKNELKDKLIILQKKRNSIWSKIFRLKNPNFHKNYYLQNPEKILKIKKKYYNKNKKKSIKSVRDWQKKNKEKVKLYSKSCYERKKLKSIIN
jgi:hypothetical protein